MSQGARIAAGQAKWIAPIPLVVLTMAPLFWRLARKGSEEPIGLLSDGGVGLLLFFLLLYSPRWLRIVVAALWAAFSIGAQELYSALRRLPTWEDLQYLTDPAFVSNSAASLNVSSPVLVWSMLLAALLVCLRPIARPRRKTILAAGLTAGVGLLSLQSYLSISHDDLSVASRHNALHWLIADAIVSPPRLTPEALARYPLPKGLAALSLDGRSLLPEGAAATNVLIVVLEGVPGLYHPEIRAAMGLPVHSVTMSALAAATPGAMLIPDFVVHSHQTIRGLYALLCGDFSKLSFSTPKALELQENPARARDCLPAQMAQRGWSTHYLQGAGLSFMGKDRFMPLIGFQEVHGTEWFKEANPFPFDWGVVDSVFFRGARDYIAELRARRHPWMLTLLTVGTHQPYAVPDDIAAGYPDRLTATVDLLDRAVAQLIEDLRHDGALDDTLVVVTSDESHGSEQGDWISSWGLGLVLAPESGQLPRLKEGTYGLVDVQASILDYLGQPIPPTVIGRSFFRDYDEPRDMVSFTASKRRWYTADGLRYECTDDGRCRVGKAQSLLGPLPVGFARDKKGGGAAIFTIGAALDMKLVAPRRVRLLSFAHGELRRLPERLGNDWSDSLIGAQYLDFPARSQVRVSIRVKAVEAPLEGIRLRLTLKQWERDLKDIPHAGFPILYAQDEGRLEFSFHNSVPRRSFSFHLLGEGKDAVVQVEEFDVTVETGKG
jgi:hypothetical protein